jgi:hypothetical protein
MRVDGGTTAEAHVATQVVPSFETKVALPALDAALDGNALAGLELRHLWTNLGDDAGRFMTKDERGANGEITVAAVFVVMH